MRSSLRSIFAVTSPARVALFALSLGVGCYGADPSASVVQEAALCGEDLVLPTQYACVQALSNVGTRGIFMPGAVEEGDDRRDPVQGSCTVVCDCMWRHISEPPSCGRNRFADEATVPTCADDGEKHHLFTIIQGVADRSACDELASRPTDACTAVCQLSATDPDALRQAPSGMVALQRRLDAGNPVEVRSGELITYSHSSTMYCCMPNPRLRAAQPDGSTERRSLTLGGVDTRP